MPARLTPADFLSPEQIEQWRSGFVRLTSNTGNTWQVNLNFGCHLISGEVWFPKVWGLVSAPPTVGFCCGPTGWRANGDGTHGWRQPEEDQSYDEIGRLDSFQGTAHASFYLQRILQLTYDEEGFMRVANYL